MKTLPVPTNAATAGASSGHLLSLRRRIEGLRKKDFAVTLTNGALGTLDATVLILAGEMLLDWLVDLPWLVRLPIFLGGAGAVGWLVRRRLVFPWRHRPGEDAVALMIERAMPIFRGRYIASIQLAREGVDSPVSGQPSLVRALVAQTATLARDRQFGHVVRTDGLKKILKRTLLGAALLGTALFFAGSSGLILLKRAFLFNDPVPTKTRVVDATGDRIVAIGDDLRIEATAAGIVPGKPGRIVITEPVHHVRSEFSFEPVPGQPARFGRLVTSVQGEFDYQIRLGDGRSATYHVAVRPRPAVAALEAEQVYPAYVRLPPVRRSLNDLALLAGSRLRLHGRASVDVKAGSVRPRGSAGPASVAMRLTSPRDFVAEVPVPVAGVDGFSVSLVDADGIETRDPTVYRIDVVPDLPPTVRIVYPDRREELVTTRARVLLAFEAADDLGIARLLLHYKITRASEGAVEGSVTEKSVEMNLGGDPPRDLRRRYEWKLGDLKPPVAVGTTVEYWLEAADANNVSGPGKGESEHFTARVVTDQEKLADLMNRTTDALTGLTEITGREEELNKQLGTVIHEKAAESAP